MVTFIVKRGEGEVLVGGLGGLGVGQMWLKEEERHRDYAGYAEAPYEPRVHDWTIVTRETATKKTHQIECSCGWWSGPVRQGTEAGWSRCHRDFEAHMRDPYSPIAGRIG